METITIELNGSQFDALDMVRTKKYVAFVGGYGSGKSFLGSLFLVSKHLENPGITTGFYCPTYRMIADIFIQSIESVAEIHDLTVKVNLSDPHVDLYEADGIGYLGRIMCRSLIPERIVGYQTAFAVLDEADVLPLQKMEACWEKIIARQRLKVPSGNRVLVTTTPEGYNWAYQKFQRTDNPAEYGLIQAATVENRDNLPDDYIQTLTDSYDEKLIQSYLLGQFTNLTSGSVYHQFDRKLNNAPGIIPERAEPLHIGLDMNVQNMSATVHVTRFQHGKSLIWQPAAPKGLPHEKTVLVAEITKMYDTPAMIDAIKREFPGHHITVYPDSSGKQRHTADAGITDIRLLQAAKFDVQAPKANPLVKDRVNNVNAMICNSKGVRRYMVNVEACPETTEALENQSYDEKTGAPDKTNNYDHLNDSLGYYVSRRYGIARPIAKVSSF